MLPSIWRTPLMGGVHWVGICAFWPEARATHRARASGLEPRAPERSRLHARAESQPNSLPLRIVQKHAHLIRHAGKASANAGAAVATAHDDHRYIVRLVPTSRPTCRPFAKRFPISAALIPGLLLS